MKNNENMFFAPSNLWIMLNHNSNDIMTGNNYLAFQYDGQNIVRNVLSFKKISLFYRELIKHG